MALALLAGVGLIIVIVFAVAAISARPPAKLVTDATLVNLAGSCPQGFSRTITLRNAGGQPLHWQAPALAEVGITDVHMTPAAGTLQPQAQQDVQVQGHTLRGGFTVVIQWQGDPLNVQFSCNGPQ